MRLTLRTLLAYLDDLLEPADAESIGQKIHDSDFATQLVGRLRDVTRRLRLSAPKLNGRGLAQDANTVAEYLDNTLPAERIPEFERICLESDVHLAEVAASHQILTLVLGAPAEVLPESRQRMYEITGETVPPSAVTPPPAPPLQTVFDVAAVDEPVDAILVEPDRPSRPKPEVPDYLRERSSMTGRWLPIVAALVLVTLLGWVIYQAVGPLGNKLASVDQEPAADEQAEAAFDPEPRPTVVEPAVPDLAPADESVEVGIESTDVVETPPTAPPLTPPAGNLAATPSSPTLPSEVMPAEPENGLGTAIPPADALDDAMPDDASEIPLVTAPATEPEMTEGESDATPSATTGANGIGRRVASNRDILLRRDPQSRLWGQLAAADILYPNDELLTLPAYRSTLTLGVGANVQMIGPTLIKLEFDPTSRVPGIEIDFGRITIMSAGRDDMQVNLVVGERRATLTFGAAETTIAIDVRSQLRVGADPAAEAAPLAADLYITSGELVWRDASGAEVKLAAPAHEVLLGNEALVADRAGVEFPAWTTGVDDARPIDQRAAMSMRDNIQPDRDIVLNLKEMASDRRPEVASLAARSLSYLDEYGALVATLSDSTQRSFWPPNIAALRDALGRGTESATLVRATFEKQRSDDGVQLYRLLCGYTPEQLQAGAARELVDLLDHEDLDFRVLGITNLTEITGTANFYRPERSIQERQSQVQKWRQRLAAGDIVPKPAGN